MDMGRKFFGSLKSLVLGRGIPFKKIFFFFFFFFFLVLLGRRGQMGELNYYMGELVSREMD